MALKATVNKVVLDVADIDRGYYAQHALTVAQHPSETDERLMVRLLAFALHAHERLVFGKGLSDADEPDLWQKDLTGAIELWVEFGQPDEKAVLRACGRSAAVAIYGFQPAFEPWWNGAAPKLERARNLLVRRLRVQDGAALAALAGRNMQLQCTIQEGQLLLSDASRLVTIDCETLRG